MEMAGVEPASKHIGTSKSTLIAILFRIRILIAVWQALQNANLINLSRFLQVESHGVVH